MAERSAPETPDSSMPSWARYLATFAAGWAGGYLFWRWLKPNGYTPGSGGLGDGRYGLLQDQGPHLLPSSVTLLPSADALRWHRAALYSMRALPRWCVFIGFFNNPRNLPSDWTYQQRQDYQFRLEASLAQLRAQVQAEACNPTAVSAAQRQDAVDAFLSLLLPGTDSSVLQSVIEDVRNGTIPCVMPPWVQSCGRPAFVSTKPLVAPKR